LYISFVAFEYIFRKQISLKMAKKRPKHVESLQLL